MKDDFAPDNAATEEGAPAWMATFGDLMSLLMCFFVLLLSFSELDRQKYKEVTGSLENAFGIQTKEQVFDSPKGNKLIAKDFDQQAIMLDNFKQGIVPKEKVIDLIQNEVDQRFQDMKGLIELQADEHKVTIRLMGESTFDSGKANIRQEMLPLLNKIATVLNDSTEDVVIAGHTDNVPLLPGSPYKSNLELSMARAATVADFLIQRKKIEPQRVATMGFGEYRPIQPNDTPEGKQKNRRVEIILGTMASALNDDN